MDKLIQNWKVNGYSWREEKQALLQLKPAMIITSNDEVKACSLETIRTKLNPTAEKLFSAILQAKLTPILFLVSTSLHEETVHLTTLEPRLQGL
jgi:hypothetical protein